MQKQAYFSFLISSLLHLPYNSSDLISVIYFIYGSLIVVICCYRWTVIGIINGKPWNKKSKDRKYSSGSCNLQHCWQKETNMVQSR